jgi:hypothetical protein
MKGIVFTPPYSSWHNPVELFFSRLKHYVRKNFPKTVEELLTRVKEYVASVCGNHVMGWYKKSGFITGENEVIPPDPNAGQADRCSLPATARFDRKEHVICVDDSGVVRREKKPRSTRWSKYDNQVEPGNLQNVSVVKRSGVKKKRKPIESCAKPADGTSTRWVGIGPRQPGIDNGKTTKLFQNDDSFAEIQRILDERVVNGEIQYFIKWKDFGDDQNQWVNGKDIQGLTSLLNFWQERNRRVDELQQIESNK